MALNDKLINQLIQQVSNLVESVAVIKSIQTEPLKPLYTNEGLMELLGVKKDLLKKYRDEGEIGYTKLRRQILVYV